MIVCSWNINSIRMRESLLIELINSLNPDIILLQEIKCQDNEFPSLYKEKNYNLVINGEKGKYGVAILVKKKIEFEEISFESDIFKYEARICGIKIKNNLNLMSVNFKNIQSNKKFFQRDLKKNIYFFGKDHLIKLNALYFSSVEKSKLKDSLKILSDIKKLNIPKFSFDGDYLKEKGMQEGAQIGKTLKIIELEWLDNDFQISKERVLEIIETQKN